MKFTQKRLFVIFLFVVGAVFVYALITLTMQTRQAQLIGEQEQQPTQTKAPSVLQTPTASASPIPTPIWSEQYPVHKNIYATLFWVGEKASGANDYIPNEASAWNSLWLENFGGIDNPYTREGYFPKGFTPKENPFYFALPYNDFSNSGRKASAAFIPWYYSDVSDTVSLLKNRWIKIKHKNEICYAQWEDVGPFEEDDYDYVFLNKKPKNERAGIDLSPSLKHCLKMATNGNVDWQFIDEVQVPDGPWKEIITTSQVNWR